MTRRMMWHTTDACTTGIQRTEHGCRMELLFAQVKLPCAGSRRPHNIAYPTRARLQTRVQGLAHAEQVQAWAGKGGHLRTVLQHLRREVRER